MTAGRAAEIRRAGDRCEQCGWLAWSNERCARLGLRPRFERSIGNLVSSWVLCLACTEKHDAKHGALSGA